MSNQIYDVVIIGAGCIGSAIARRLSRYRLKIAVLEKGTEVCQGTTKANSAIVHGGYDNVPGSLKARLNVRGNEMFAELADELGFAFDRIGSLVLAFDEEDMDTIGELYERGIKNGVKGLEILNREQVLKMEPEVSESVCGALFCGSAAIIDPFGYNYALIENAIENGVKLFTDTEVIGINLMDEYLEVLCADRRMESRIVINAAGVHSGDLAEMVGDSEFKIIPTKGVYRLLDKDSGSSINHVLFQTPTAAGKGVLITPTYHGNLMVGPTSSQTVDLEDNTTDTDSITYLDEKGKKSVPGIDLSKTIRIFTGVRAKPDTGDFMIYPSKNIRGLIHVGGIESPGLASSPAIAEYLEELVRREGAVLETKPTYNPIRESAPVMSELSDSDRTELILKRPEYGRIVCRCEGVSEGEIVDAIKRPAGAVTVDGVKRRVRPGMGRCQGGFCGPKVIEILARELGIPPEHVLKEHRGSEILKGKLK